MKQEGRWRDLQRDEEEKLSKLLYESEIKLCRKNIRLNVTLMCFWVTLMSTIPSRQEEVQILVA